VTATRTRARSSGSSHSRSTRRAWHPFGDGRNR
jgi:hypothetical protein